MQNFRDYYEILGISKEASAGEIKQAYRALARQYHPDLNPGDKAAEEKFKLLGEAYDILSDVDKRSQYEEYSRYWNQKGFKAWGRRSKRGGSVSVEDAEYSAFDDFDNFVEQLLKRHKGSDKDAAQWAPSVSQAAPSSRDSVTAKRQQPSRDRSSNRSASPSSSRTDRRIDNRNDGRNDVGTTDHPGASQSERRSDNRRSASVSNRSSRPNYKRQPAPPSRRDAEADLTVPLEKAYAGGRERIRLEDGRSLEVSMPAGMVTGQRIRLKGQGIDGGNLYLRIEVEPHPYFTLQEGDVYCRLPVTPSEAVLGATIAVPTLGGLVNMMIPPGVQSGQRLRLTGKGYPISQGLLGDQIVEIEVAVPTVLDDEEKALYQEMREIERFDPRANLPV